MSWSVSYIGTAQKIIDALNDQSEKLQGPSKEEFDSALPHLRGLLAENYAPNAPLLKLDASGSGYSTRKFDSAGIDYTDTKEEQRSCTVQLETLWGVLV
jgi:hypothetical protein